MNKFEKICNGDLIFYTIPLFNEHGVKTAFTTKHGGVSTEHLATMNMSFTRGDKRANVVENYQRIAKALGVNYNNYAFSYQIHEDNVHEVTDADIGIDELKTKELVKADALVTNRMDVPLVKHSADCTIVYIYDPINKAIGLVHSGWRSTIRNIVGKTIDKMISLYDTNPNELLGAISPCLGQCCFEVGTEVSDLFEEEFLNMGVVSYDYTKPHVDLVKSCQIQLIQAGLNKNNIAMANICSGCNRDEFFSYRIEKGKCGLAIGILSL